MRPYYEHGGITVFHGDCREILPLLERVDHVITDPPYAARAMKNFRSGSTIKQYRDGEIRDFGYEALDEDLRRDSAREMVRLCGRWLLVWSDIENAHLWRRDLECAGARYIRTGVWVREHAAPQFSGDRPAQGVEACVITHHAKERLAWNGGGRPATWIGPIVNSQGERFEHTSPKPLWLMKQLIADFTNPDDLILDPFAGSLTTLVAAKALGRRAIGIEIEEKFIEAGLKRLSQEVLL